MHLHFPNVDIKYMFVLILFYHIGALGAGNIEMLFIPV